MGFDRVSVSDLLRTPGLRRSIEVSVPVEVSLTDATVKASATGTVLLESVSGGLLARGEITVPAELVCQRCLKGFQADVVGAVSQLYGKLDDPDVLPIEQGGRINLEDVVRDEAVLALPNAPICREGCLGICDSCGTDLNMHPCGGHERENLSPFAVLEDLFQPES
jgi:uncharacterized protein